MTIKEMEERTGLDRANIRFYEKEGLLAPERLQNGYRDYTEADAETLLRIRLLRSLHLPLTEIRALQQGKRTLSDAMRDHLHTLDTEKQAVTAAEDVCRAIQADSVRFENLNAGKYLEQLNRGPQTDAVRYTPPAEDTYHPPIHPWRRYFARTLDYDLYLLPLELIVLLGFHINPGSNLGRISSLVCGVLAYVLMLVLEPLLLHCFGTTPGKWLFGLRLTDADGTKLTYEEGIQRTWGVISRGYGFDIPGYSLYRLWQCYKLCMDGQTQDWDDFPHRRLYTIRDTKPWRGIAWLAAATALVFLNFLAAEYAALPPNRGNLTVAEFAENFNYLRDYYSTAPADSVYNYSLAENGEWEALSNTANTNVYSIESLTVSEPIPFEYRMDQNGHLTGIHLATENGELWDLVDISDFEYAALAYITAQPGCTIFSRTTERVVRQMESRQFTDVQFTEHGVTVSLTYEFSDEAVEYTFSLTKNPQT